MKPRNNCSYFLPLRGHRFETVRTVDIQVQTILKSLNIMFTGN